MTETPQVLASRNLPEAVTRRLVSSYKAKLNEQDQLLSGQALAAGAEGVDGLIVTPTDKLTAEVVAALPENVKIVATFSVGTDHIDLEAARKRGLIVTNTPGVLTDATADIALLLILAATRRAYEGERLVRDDQWSAWSTTMLCGMQVTSKRLGILGMGRIGQAVAERARAFGMEIHYSKRSRLSPEEEKGAIYHDSPEALLQVSDILSIHCPSTEETRHFLNAKRIEMMPRGAVVVNTARGDIVEDEALIAALKCGRLSAAGLDVFAGEPKINPGYRTLTNVFLLPHLGSATIETRNAMGFKCLDNLDAFFAGKMPPDRVY